MSSSTAATNPGLVEETGWKTVCLLEDLVVGSGVCVLFENKQVALFHVGKPPMIHAIANHDPFSKANVLSRGIIGSLQGKVVVASPIFKQHFCLETGQCIEDDSVSVDTYQARIKGNHVQLKKSP